MQPTNAQARVPVLRSNSDDRRHAPRAVPIAAVGIKEVRVASCAEIDCDDKARCEPGYMKLVFCHRNQVKMRRGFWIGAVPRWLHVQE